MEIIELIEKEVKEKINEYKLNSEDNYDFWEEHIKLVYAEAKKLADLYNADLEIVSLGALLHDIALICQVGDRKDHHINGKILADEMLTKYGYSNDKKERVLNCVYNHRSSKNANTVEEQCVADADILAHFDNIPLIFNMAFNKYNVKLTEIKQWMKSAFEKDYNDLSDKTKQNFTARYKMICEIILGQEN